MDDSQKTKQQLIEELKSLRSKISHMEDRDNEFTELKKYQQSILDNAGTVILILSLQITILEWNSKAEKIYGYKKEEVLGKNYIDLFISDDYKIPVTEEIQEILAGKECYKYENPVLSRDGLSHFMMWNATPLRDDDGQVIGLLAFGQDISDRKQMEEELRESEERFKFFYEASFEGIVVTRQGKVIDSNNRFAQMSGYAADEIVGMSVADLIYHEDVELALKRNLSNYDKPYEIRGVRKDGSQSYIEVCGKPIRYKGEDCRIIAINDITQRRLVEQKESYIQDLVEKSSRVASLGVIASGITHEINQPLNAISLSAGSILFQNKKEPGMVPPKVISKVNTIQDCVDKISKIIARMRSMWIEESPSFEKINVSEIVNSSCDMIVAKASSHGIVINKEFPDLDMYIMWSESNLEQAIVNLFVNSIQLLDRSSTNAKRINVEVYERVDSIYILFRDNSDGIPKGEEKKIFDTFYSIKMFSAGTGIGLAVVERYITQMGGSISVSNLDEGGLEIKIKLPKIQENNNEDLVS